MALDLKSLGLNKKPAANQEAPVEAPVETETHSTAVQVKTGNVPTKPKLAFALGAMNQKVAETPTHTPAPASTESAAEEPEAGVAENQAGEMNQGGFEISPSEPQVEPIRDFRTVLNELDSLFVEGTGYTQLTIDTARKRVVEAMKELHANPELRAIVKDTDVRNIMAFINHSADSARANIAEKKTKAQRTSTRKQARMAIDLSGMGAGITAAMGSGAIPKDLSSLATMDLTKIQVGAKRGKA